ncbi:NAD(P)/FAD-dependent oxidoreductase [Winogradskya humida]|uniref:Thioredoxin reductase n=1 Tax=Winogradskya humida TaxID=113566 RepID=A0ABQ4A1Q9_9ACTN|nr:NAD(P)/FAD-dependent oxidoreductase [Actinoplanes humidus]GIE24548.1 thioredoxin reductase [Actinoplanes humidus]
MTSHQRHYDVVVIGAGAAGLTAAVMLARTKLQVLVVALRDRFNSAAEGVRNLPYAEGIAPSDLYGTMERTAIGYGVRFVWDEARTASATDDLVTVATRENGEFTADRLLLATGPVTDLPAWLPEGTWGKRVFECPFCHTYENDGDHFACVGAGRETLGMALMSVQYAATMTAVIRDEEAAAGPLADRLRARGGTVLVDEVATASTLAGGEIEMVTKGGVTLTAGAILLTGVKQPAVRFAETLGLELNERGGARTLVSGRTSHPRVWSAGSANAPSFFLWTGAASSGQNAAQSICEDIAFGPLQSSYWQELGRTASS